MCHFGSPGRLLAHIVTNVRRLRVVGQRCAPPEVRDGFVQLLQGLRAGEGPAGVVRVRSPGRRLLVGLRHFRDASLNYLQVAQNVAFLGGEFVSARQARFRLREVASLHRHDAQVMQPLHVFRVHLEDTFVTLKQKKVVVVINVFGRLVYTKHLEGFTQLVRYANFFCKR